MPPIVTISIPLYKCEEFLERCLESVKVQTYRPIEVTLINDQTPDNSVRIAEKFIEKYNLENWKIYHLEKNSGLSVVRNKGIDTAQGKYLFFLDSDDEITPDCIEKLVEIAERENAEMTVSQIECRNAENGKKFFCLGKLQNIETIQENQKVFEAFVNDQIPSSAVNKLFLVSFFKKNKIYFTPGLYAQDELWTFQSCLKLECVAFQSDVTYIYHLHEKSVIHNRNKKNFDNWFTIGEYIDEALRNEKKYFKKQMILKYLIRYKDMTLIMNWRAQKDEALWKGSYRNYQKLSSLSLLDYFSPNYSTKLKKKDFLMSLPSSFGMWIFKWRWKN